MKNEELARRDINAELTEIIARYDEAVEEAENSLEVDAINLSTETELMYLYNRYIDRGCDPELLDQIIPSSPYNF